MELITVLGPIAGYLLKHYLDERKWKKVNQTAKAILEQTDEDDPSQAVIDALIETHMDRLVKETEKVKQAFTPKGTFPKLGIDVEIETDKPKAPSRRKEPRKRRER